jgi:NitT/TauT family transport system substrate-binding protein
MIGLVLVALSGCTRSREKPPLRIGFLPNLTQAQALVGNADGTFANALRPTPVEIQPFNAGPAAMEALLGGSLDVAYIGSGPALTAWARAPGALHVISGSAAGGSVLIARHAKSANELKGKKVGSPQLGNTQDVALRIWLKQNGLSIADPDRDARPGEVEVIPVPNPDLLALFRRGDLEAAWVPEPWGARLIAEAGGHVLVDEADLWPRHIFPTTLLVASSRALKERRDELLALVRAQVELTRRARADEAAFFAQANRAYGAITGHPLPEGELSMARGRITLELDPLAPELATAAAHAQTLDFIPKVPLDGLVDPSLLDEVLHGQPRPGMPIGGSPR